MHAMSVMSLITPAATSHHHQISSAPITLRPYMHYSVNVDALNRSLLSKN